VTVNDFYNEELKVTTEAPFVQ